MPLQNISPVKRVILALLPTVITLMFFPYLPKIVSQTPAVIFYPIFFLATWLGGVWAGLISLLSSLSFALIYIRPHLLTAPMSDVPHFIRSNIFLFTCLLFLLLLGALQKALKEAHEAIELRDEFLDLASHELKTPLTSMKLNLETVRRILPDDETTVGPKKLLVSCQRQANRLERLIMAMTDLTLFDSGHLMLMRTKCDLYKIVQDVVASLNTQQISITTPERQFPGYWDQVRVEQIISNLVHNAVKYGQGKPILIEIGVEDNLVICTIRDQGVGIEAKDHKRIFERFQRANTAVDVQGLGLGLYLTKKLIELHNGKIAVESSPDKGSNFTVKLPA